MTWRTMRWSVFSCMCWNNINIIFGVYFQMIRQYQSDQATHDAQHSILPQIKWNRWLAAIFCQACGTFGMRCPVVYLYMWMCVVIMYVYVWSCSFFKGFTFNKITYPLEITSSKETFKVSNNTFLLVWSHFFCSSTLHIKHSWGVS